MKRIISLLLCISVLLTVIPALSVSAEDLDGAYEVLLAGILAFEENIDIRQYNVSTSSLSLLVNGLISNEPMMFNFNTCKYYYTDKVLSVVPTYRMTQEEYEEKLEFIQTEIQAILDTIPEGLDDYEKALYLHDYIALNFCYDLTYTIRTLDGFLEEKTGVCAAYVLLYDELLTRIGIENYAVHSASLNHVWNQIKINDNWYHVDITWDDPVGSYDVTDKGYYARAWHDDFLESDAAIMASHATDIESKYPCTDTTFDNLSWKNKYYPVGFANGNTYILEDDNIWLLDIKTGNKNLVYDTNTEIYRSEITGKIYMNYPYFGSYNNKLIYHNGESLLSYDPQTNTTEVLHTPETEEAIALFYVSGNTINYIIGTTNIAAEGTEYTFVIEDLMCGDINGDNSITSVDYISLKRAVMEGLDPSVPAKIWDINGDEVCTILDYITLKRVVMGTYVLN